MKPTAFFNSRKFLLTILIVLAVLIFLTINWLIRGPTKFGKRAEVLNSCPIKPVVNNAYCEVDEDQPFSPYSIIVKDSNGNILSTTVTKNGNFGPIRVGFIAFPGETYRCEVKSIDERCLNSTTASINCAIPTIIPSIVATQTPTPTGTFTPTSSPSPTVFISITPTISKVPTTTITEIPTPTIFACPVILKDVLVIEPILTPQSP